MNYAIIRNTNYKLKNLNGIYRHIERKNTNYSNKDIDKNCSIKNYSLKSPHSTYEKEFNLIKEKYHLKGQIKNVSNIACEYVITSSKNYFDQIGSEDTKRFFKTAYSFVCNHKQLGEKYILSAKVHMDEKTPHMHIVFIPIIHTTDKKGNAIDKVACSEFWKGKNSYQLLQNDFHKYMKVAGFDLERGNTKENKHIPIETLKSITNYENIKFEMEQEEIQPIETQNTSLIVAQNKELVQYVKKLKQQLAKSYIAIQKVDTLQKENIELEQENYKLQQENSKLKNYIDKTFQAVKILFDFPIDTLKRLVDNFVKSMEK